MIYGSTFCHTETWDSWYAPSYFGYTPLYNYNCGIPWEKIETVLTISMYWINSGKKKVPAHFIILLLRLTRGGSQSWLISPCRVWYHWKWDPHRKQEKSTWAHTGPAGAGKWLGQRGNGGEGQGRWLLTCLVCWSVCEWQGNKGDPLDSTISHYDNGLFILFFLFGKVARAHKKSFIFKYI